MNMMSMQYHIYFLFMLLFILSCAECLSKTIWNPEELAQLNSSRIVDPENYLKTPETIKEIEAYMNQTSLESYINVQFFIFSEIPWKYSYLFWKNIDLFSLHLWNLLYDDNQESGKNSTIMVLAITDKEILIKSGMVAGEYMTDDRNQAIMNEIKLKYFQTTENTNYEVACIEIAKLLYENSLKEPKTFSVLLYQFMIVLVGAISLVSLIACYVKVLRTSKEERKIMLIKSYYEENLPPDKFLEEICGLCLEKLEPGNIDLPPTPRSSLLCIHLFHHNCYKNWSKVNSTCPLCKLEIDDYRLNAASFYERILKIQLCLHPRMKDKIRYMFGGRTLTYEISG